MCRLVIFILFASAATAQVTEPPILSRQTDAPPAPAAIRVTPVVRTVAAARKSIVMVKVLRIGLKDGVGTGVIVSESGSIITARHVVAGQSKVVIAIWDGTELSGEVVRTDPDTDLAVVRVRTKAKLDALRPAAAKGSLAGETVVAIGHPYGYANTVSTGVISALGREIRMPTGDTITGLIQTTVPLNPGYSGGPLLNLAGEFIGVNIAMREGAQGISFAVDAAKIAKLLSQ